MKGHDIWEVYCKWTKWNSTTLHLTSHLLPAIYADTHNAETWMEQHWRWRSTTFSKCIASKQSKTSFLSFWSLLCYPHFTQTFKTLYLAYNDIGDETAQHLANALQENRVRFHIPLYDLSSTIVISHRYLQHWTFERTISVQTEHGI